VETSVREPDEVQIDDLMRVDLVLVDLDLGDWLSQRDFAPISLQPPDGLALTTVLRRHLVSQQDKSPTGFAIFTGRVDTISRPFPHENRLHLLAHSNNLEWIFLKEDTDFAKKVASLASAIRLIPPKWRDGIHSVNEISDQLNLDPEILPLERYEEVIQDCHPPIYELTEWTHGLAFIRWMLHKILVYPCFLWDLNRLAGRLRIDLKELRRVLTGRSRLERQLSKLQYKGILWDFDGPRWWRPAVELFLWKITDGDSQNNDQIYAALGKLAGRRLRPANVEQPVVCIDRNYKPIDRFFSYADVVRVQPDDWPGYADSAFMTIQEVKARNELLSLVVAEDRGKIRPHDDGQDT